ncbi:hypothetical protein H8744_09290 [Oscillospiraceae bacterium N12]|jgi:hypothetical protein|uniref:Uncharacterized protein n=1 Tax=Jilunia laotingensis TaxID=2763675 RepID=A0A926F3N8_9BACT|nr:DUF6769 family protein [Jilunia laotingensis]MBC8593435.1 hypothetical protein [Jilunia laotingensis]
MRNKWYIICLLFFVSIIMLAVPIIPHHHHANGLICMKHDVKPEAQCPAHNHHQHSDSCCDSECLTRFSSPAPTMQSDFSPHYVFIDTLFADLLIDHLLRPLEKQLNNEYVYRESLHGTNITRAFALRGPPSHTYSA